MASRNVFFFFELLFWPIVGVLSIGLMTRFLHLTPEQASFVLIGTIALSVVSVFVCALITLFGNRAEAFAWASVNLVLVLAGLYYPVSVLPEPVATVAAAIPLTYFLDAYRAHFGFAPEFRAPIAAGLALSAVYATLAHWCFFAALQRARRTGLLLKMSE